MIEDAQLLTQLIDAISAAPITQLYDGAGLGADVCRASNDHVISLMKNCHRSWWIWATAVGLACAGQDVKVIPTVVWDLYKHVGTGNRTAIASATLACMVAVLASEKANTILLAVHYATQAVASAPNPPDRIVSSLPSLATALAAVLPKLCESTATTAMLIAGLQSCRSISGLKPEHHWWVFSQDTPDPLMALIAGTLVTAVVTCNQSNARWLLTLRLALLTGDAHGNCAVAGGLFGALYGIGNLPITHYDGVQWKPALVTAADALLSAPGERGGGSDSLQSRCSPRLMSTLLCCLPL